MIEPLPSPEAIPPTSAKVKHGINWHRVRVYFLSIMVMGAMWVGGTLIIIRLHPKRVVDGLLSRLPYSYSVGKVDWLNRRTLKIDDVKVGGFFYADSIIVTASPWGLWRHHVAKVQVIGGQVYTKPLYAAMDQVKGGEDGLDWGIGRLEISRGTLMLDNLLADTSIPVSLGRLHPIVLKALRLGKPDSSPEMNQERTVEIGQVNIISTVDPLVRVFSFPLTRVRFTYTEFWHHHLREIDVIRPTLYLGEDLFWLVDAFKKERKTAPAQGPSAPWEVAHFEVRYGQLAVNAFGQPVAHLPFFFGTKVDDIRLDQLDQISAKSVIPIENLSQDYPDYKVRIVNLSGRLFFNWPPSDANANNVFNYIKIQKISWNHIPVTNVYTKVTFDPRGVFGTLTGKCEGGDLSGNFEFYYTKGFTWNVNLFANKVNCQPIAQKLGGKYLSLTGELDGNLTVQGKMTDILNCQGSLSLPKPGVLEFKSMDELMDRLPPDTITLKRDAVKIAIDAFQTYPYQNGMLKINYKPVGGVGSLKLEGPRGQRLFQVYFHPWNLTEK
jgi:hypothetical protein